MPKNTSDLVEVEETLKIYYENGDWLENEQFKVRLKAAIGDDQYPSSYTKKIQIPAYFGFIEWEDIDNAKSKKRITNIGKNFYNGLKNKNEEIIQETIVKALELVKFGRDNFGANNSVSDIDPPCVFIRASLDLNGLSVNEFSYLLQSLIEGEDYTDIIEKIQFNRSTSKENFKIREEFEKYNDSKPIIILEKWGFLEKTPEGNRKVRDIVLSKYESRLKNLKIYNVDKNIHSNYIKTKIEIDEDTRVEGGENVIFYGVPGTGKSYLIENNYCRFPENIERIVFHEEYSYTDFVGQIVPTTKLDINTGMQRISYEFNGGPFTKILNKALKTPQEMFYLVIEEINRGNAASIFGDIFQLLDRNHEGGSEYAIINHSISKFVYGDEETPIKIPSNLSIIGTMNTSDQGVFPLDTAFQRRWNMFHVKNDIDSAPHAKHKILDTDIEWGNFVKITNDNLLNVGYNYGASEDKRLGIFFIKESDLVYDTNTSSPDVNLRFKAELQNRKFGEKVLKYLWEDAFKLHRTSIFKDEYKALEQLLEAFENIRFEVFKISYRGK